MASLVVLLIVIGCVAYQYFKGTTVKAVATIIVIMCSSIAAFSYFELLADYFISRSISRQWAQPLFYVLLFIFAFALLQTVVNKLSRKSIDLGHVPEIAGRCICGIVIGLLISGVLLVALDMAPLSDKYPYQRFASNNTKPEMPGRVFPSADGFVTGFFGLVSRGGLSGQRSFSVVHPSFVDESFLNRLGASGGVSINTKTQAIEAPKKDAAWLAPENLTDTTNSPISSKTGHTLTMVRVGVKQRELIDAGNFTCSQVRLICRRKNVAAEGLSGKGINVYPIGYLNTAGKLQLKRLSEKNRLESGTSSGSAVWVDFAFYVPNDYTPVLVAFKQNNIAEIPKVASLGGASSPEL